MIQPENTTSQSAPRQEPSNTTTRQSAWMRLQCLSCIDAAQIGRQGIRQHYPPGDIKENCEILGRGNEEEIKNRIHWYIAFKPSVFDPASAANWKY